MSKSARGSCAAALVVFDKCHDGARHGSPCHGSPCAAARERDDFAALDGADECSEIALEGADARCEHRAARSAAAVRALARDHPAACARLRGEQRDTNDVNVRRGGGFRHRG